MVEEQLKQLAEVLQYTLSADKKERREGEKYFIFLCSYITFKYVDSFAFSEPFSHEAKGNYYNEEFLMC